MFPVRLVQALDEEMKKIKKKQKRSEIAVEEVVSDTDEEDEGDELQQIPEDKPKSHWAVPKVHCISHYKGDIERSGVSSEYCSELFEHLHQKVNNTSHIPLIFVNLQIECLILCLIPPGYKRPFQKK